MLRAIGLRVDWHGETAAQPPVAPPAISAPPRPAAAPAPVAATSAPIALPAATSLASAAAPALQPVPAGLAQMGWDELRHAVAACRACRLCDGRKQTVFGVGHPRAHWMVVGEAPGAQEDEQGEPFVGAAGQLLDAMLRALALSRGTDGDGAGDPARHVYIANTLKCRPPGNRNPQADEMAQCEPFLLRQIELVQPRLILAMGRFAVQALLRSSEPIGKLRGRVHRYQGVPLVVTYHPAYLLRNLPDKAKAWEDLCLAAEVAEATEEAKATDRTPAIDATAR
jgi:DNA polymerase